MKSKKLKIVNTHLNFPKVTLKSPLNTGFIIIAAEIDKKNSFFGESKTKKLLLKDVKLLLKKFKNHTNIKECTIFKAVLFPPGRNGEYFKKINQENIIHTKFDVVLQIETSSPNKINRIKKNNIFRKIENLFKNLSSFHYIYNAKNSKTEFSRMTPLDLAQQSETPHPQIIEILKENGAKTAEQK